MTVNPQPLILLTGASGVVGSEVVKALPAERLILARHRARPEASSEQIQIDIRDPGLGIDRAAYDRLAGRVGAIVHCAAVTDMGGAAHHLNDTNIAGVRHILAFARYCGVPIHYVSTAYCSEQYGPRNDVASAYVATKRAGEDLVRSSGLDWTIIRPSIVAGHSKTGAIAAFQGFHLFIAAMLKGRLPFIPLAREARCDFVPADLVARAIARIAEAPVYGRTYWLTSGGDAITVDQMIDCGRPFAAAMGRDLDALPIVDPEAARRDHLPRLQQGRSRRLADQLETLLELASVMATKQAFPTDMAGLGIKPEISQGFLCDVLSANIRQWRSQTQRPGSPESLARP